MPITVNEKGTLYTLDTITANEGGTLYGLDTIYSNEGGTLYEIFSASALPKSLNWNIKSASGTSFPNAKINSSSDDGFSLNVYVRYESLNVTNMSFLYTDVVTLKAGTKISYTTSDLSGTGRHQKYLSLYLGKGEALNYISLKSDISLTGGYTVQEDGEYHFSIGGASVTHSGSQGQISDYYPVTGNVNISLSR